MKESKLIYYLDDDMDDLKFFRDVTEEMGHRVALFMNGNEMLYALKHDWEKPDLIFLDVHMPILNGEEMLNIIKKSEDFKHIPTVMISGVYPKKLVKQYLESGADYLMKKSGQDDFRLTLEQLFAMDFEKHALH
jgi:CheY-like chemotaxis protein